jgi:dipeptidyl aminopeptidase/acylaminoacyl peptidase
VSTRRVLLLTPLLALVVACGGRAAHVAPSHPVPSHAAESGVTHRVVWDLAPRRGSDVRASDPDGSHAVTLFSSPDHTVTNLSISPDGRQVAFDSHRRGARARLLTTPTTGGTPVDVLRRQRRFEDIGPIGWSPNGTKLVFEGSLDTRSTGLFRPTYLCTIRADGTRLRVLDRIGDGTTAGAVFGGIAWTPQGIVFPADHRVLRFAHGRSRTLVDSVASMRTSGDNQQLYLRTTDPTDPLAAQRVYRVSATDLRRDLVATLPDPALGDLLDFQPDHDGSRLIGLRTASDGTHTEAVTFSPSRPRDVQVLDFVGPAFSITWS